MDDGEKHRPRKTVAVTSHRRRHWLFYGLLLTAVPLALMTLLSSFEAPPDSSTRVARELEQERAKRSAGFPAAPGTHKVVRVVTGDTIDVRAPGSGVARVRLACIDAPERGQRYWLEARRHLARLIDAAFVTVTYTGQNLDGVDGVKVDAGDLAVGIRMVADGYAWDFERASCGIEYALLQREAESEGLGLWADLNPVEPWRWKILQGR